MKKHIATYQKKNANLILSRLLTKHTNTMSTTEAINEVYPPPTQEEIYEQAQAHMCEHNMSFVFLPSGELLTNDEIIWK